MTISKQRWSGPPRTPTLLGKLIINRGRVCYVVQVDTLYDPIEYLTACGEAVYSNTTVLIGYKLTCLGCIAEGASDDRSGAK